MQSRKQSSGKPGKPKTKKAKREKKKKKKKKKAKASEFKVCDLCSCKTIDPDPVTPSAVLRWGRPHETGKECYYCRRLRRFDVRNAMLSLA